MLLLEFATHHCCSGVGGGGGGGRGKGGLSKRYKLARRPASLCADDDAKGASAFGTLCKFRHVCGSCGGEHPTKPCPSKAKQLTATLSGVRGWQLQLPDTSSPIYTVSQLLMVHVHCAKGSYIVQPFLFCHFSSLTSLSDVILPPQKKPRQTHEYHISTMLQDLLRETRKKSYTP